MADSDPPRPSQPVLDAEANAKTGDFSGLPAIIGGLTHENPDVRLRAAYVAGRIGSAQAIDRLSHMALHDQVSDNRNQALLALAGVGRPAVVPALIDALNDDEVERRMDARIALYQVLGPEVFEPLVEEDEDEGPDAEEIARVKRWWEERAARFEADRAYAFGALATPGVFVFELASATAHVPDAYLHALTDWTGQDFGQSPMATVIKKWTTWWSANESRYEPGRRYFFGHPVP